MQPPSSAALACQEVTRNQTNDLHIFGDYELLKIQNVHLSRNEDLYSFSEQIKMNLHLSRGGTGAA